MRVPLANGMHNARRLGERERETLDIRTIPRDVRRHRRRRSGFGDARLIQETSSNEQLRPLAPPHSNFIATALTYLGYTVPPHALVLCL